MNKQKTVALLTIGHSPREDIVTELRGLIRPDIGFIHRGVLDEFLPEEASARFACEGNEPTMVSRLSSGKMGVFSAVKIMPLLQRAIDQVCSEGADCVVLLCTNRFDELRCEVPLIVPFSVMHSLVASIDSGMSVGALFPFESHAAPMARYWKDYGIDLEYACAAPGSEIDYEAVAEKFRKKDLLILDCIGYTGTVRRELSKRLKVPVLWPRALIADLVNGLLMGE